MPIATSFSEPRWILKHAAATVGPVSTNALLRGLAMGSIPAESTVAQVGWRTFRPLFEIREVNAWRHARARVRASGLREPPFNHRGFNLTASLALARVRAAAWREPRLDLGAPLRLACDRGEVLLLALGAARDLCHAETGLLYRVREPLPLPVVSYAFGEGLACLGEIVRADDPVYREAIARRMLVGKAECGVKEQAIARRLSSDPLCGVAMLPLFAGGHLLGVIELGRSMHAFRHDDGSKLEQLPRAVAARYAALHR